MVDGVIDAVSVGVTPTKFSYDEEGVMIVESATWSELSLVSEGAFSGAVITEVAASAPDEPVEGIHETEPQVELQSDQETTKDTDMSDKTENTVVEAAQATTEKLWAQPARKFNLPTPGEYFAAMHIGGTTFENVARATKEFVKANQSALQAAAGDIATTDTPGLLPVPVLGPVFQDLNFIRPVVNAVGARAMPNNGASKTFVRPTITTHTSVAAQAAEFDAASATTMVIASNTVSKTTLSGSGEPLNSRPRLYRSRVAQHYFERPSWRILDCIRQRCSRRNHRRRYSVRCDMGSHSRRPNNFD
jgi:hypothetical protein